VAPPRPQPGHPADGVYFGLMSGTSMDGVDGVAARFETGKPPVVLAEAFVGFADTLRDALFALQQPGDNEIEREALAANGLAARYAVCCHELLRGARLAPEHVRAIGVHGQTVRHRPERGYTRQINNAALLAELTRVDVIADFRSRDVAAGGQGAPLAPGFHAMVFGTPGTGAPGTGAPGETRVVCNLGGISNITILPARADAPVHGFDCGPANALLDAWTHRHLNKPYDDDGRFAARGHAQPVLLDALLDEPYFRLPPPKSTGRDLFNPDWLDAKLAGFAQLAPEDVQATLVALTAVTVARDVAQYAPDCARLFVCGGGARNPVLLDGLREALAGHGSRARVATTAELGVPPQQVEALAFAWLAYRFNARAPGNLATVTGAAGERVLGALYPR
jgi:anhydro-N-acetylmuramic acid kinase